MNRILRLIIICLSGAALMACITLACLAGRDMRSRLTCNGMKVTVTDSARNDFVSKEEIRRHIEKEYGAYEGICLDSIDLTAIEELVDRKEAVLKSQAYVTKDGTLHITVTQRQPAVRFQKKEGGFYADAEGFIFPLQDSHAAHVQVIDGYIPLSATSGYNGTISQSEKEWFDSIMNLVNHIDRSQTWKNKFVNIHVGKNHELTLVPRYGNEKILFGHPVDIQTKLDKLEKYYTSIIPEKGKDYYKTVDLRFEGQIVCSRN